MSKNALHVTWHILELPTLQQRYRTFFERSQTDNIIQSKNKIQETIKNQIKVDSALLRSSINHRN